LANPLNLKLQELKLSILRAYNQSFSQGEIITSIWLKNIVKEEFHKGALFGLRVSMAIIDEERTPKSVEPAQQTDNINYTAALEEVLMDFFGTGPLNLISNIRLSELAARLNAALQKQHCV